MRHRLYASSSRRLASLSLLLTTLPVAADWPQFRGGPERVASAEAGPEGPLHEVWSAELPARLPLYATDVRAAADLHYAPVADEHGVLISLHDPAGVLALNRADGSTTWFRPLAAPVRFAPVLRGDRVWAGTDEGLVVCLDRATGDVIWTWRPPAPRRWTVQQGGLISRHAISAAPTLAGDRLVFAVGTWTEDRPHLVVLDPMTGDQRLFQPIRGPVWGYPAVSGDLAVIPAGTSEPRLYRLDTGEPAGTPRLDRGNPLHAGVAILGPWFQAGARFLLLAEPGGSGITFYGNAEHGIRSRVPVVDGTHVYGINDGVLRIFPRPEAGASRLDPVGNWWMVYKLVFAWTREVTDELAAPDGADLERRQYPRQALAKAGDSLYAGGEDVLYRFDVADPSSPRILQVFPVKGRPVEAAPTRDGLYVATDAHRLVRFGMEASARARAVAPDLPSPRADAAGLALAFGRARPPTWPEDATEVSVLASVEPDDLGTAVAGDLTADEWPPYAAVAVAVDGPPEGEAERDAAWLRRLWPVLVPGRGVLSIRVDDMATVRLQEQIPALGLDAGRVEIRGGWLTLTRPAPRRAVGQPDLAQVLERAHARGRRFAPPAETPNAERARLRREAEEALEADDLRTARARARQLLDEHGDTAEGRAAVALLARVNLAEADELRRLGRFEAARNLYETVMGQDPEGPVGQAARTRLDDLALDAMLEGDDLLDGLGL